MTTATITPRPGKKPVTKRRRTPRRAASLQSHGEPMVWLTGGALAVALAMIVGLLAWILSQGTRTFWPGDVTRIETVAGKIVQGEVSVDETYRPGPESSIVCRPSAPRPCAPPSSRAEAKNAAACCAPATSTSPARTTRG